MLFSKFQIEISDFYIGTLQNNFVKLCKISIYSVGNAIKKVQYGVFLPRTPFSEKGTVDYE